MATKSMASYWDGDSWEDFSISSVSRVYNLVIVDTLGKPRAAKITISNNSSNPQSNSAASSKGPFTGLVEDFTPIKIRDTDTGECYFYGAATKVTEEFSTSDGMFLVIEATDYLFELRDQTTTGRSSFRQIANDRALIATLNEDLDNSETAITVTNTDELQIGMRITFASNDEDMIITEIVSSTVINVVRGVNGEFDTHSNGAAMFEAATPIYQFIPRKGVLDGNKEEYVKPYGSRGGLVKSFVDHFSNNLRHPGISVQVNEAIDSSETELTVIDSTHMFVGQILKVDNEEMLVTAVTDKTTITVEREYRGTTAATHSDKAILQAVDDRWTDSVTNYAKNGLLKLSKQANQSVLKHMRSAAVSEPHYALTSDQDGFGYDFYVSPNITSTGNSLSTSFLDYFKKGTRPTSETLGPTAFGLNVHYPSPDTITNGSFVTTGRQIPMTQSNFTTDRGEFFTDLTVNFNSTSRGVSGDAVTTNNTENFELIEVYNINTSSNGFTYPGRNISGGILTIGGADLSYADSAEGFRKLMTQINMGGDFSAGATSLTVDSTADMYVGQVLFIGFPGEQVLITAINSSTNLTVQRGHNGTTDATRSDDAFISTIVGRIQYLTAGTNTVNSDPAVETAYMLISHIDPALNDSTVIWGTASAVPALNSFFGNDSGYSFQLKAGGRTRISKGIRKTQRMSLAGTVDPDTIRERTAAALLRYHNPPVRGDIQSVYPPHFYLDNVPSAVSGSGTAEITVGNTLLTGTLNEGLDVSETDISVTDSTGMYVGQRIKIDSEEFAITAVNSKILITATRAQNSTSAAEHTSGASIYDSNVDLTKYGFRTGMCINELDSNGQPTATYGYATWVSATKVKVTWSTGSVSTSSNLRYYIPVRAADSIRVRSDIQNVAKTMIVVGVEYRESNGGVSTRYEVVEDSPLQSSEFSGTKVSGLSDTVNTEDALPSEPEFAANPTITTTCVFSSSSASQVDWSAGNLHVGNDVYAISAGDSSYLSALNSDGRVYYVYYIKGETIFRVIDDGDYAALVQERNDSDFKIIAEINYDLPYAVWRLVGIKGGFAQSSSPTSIPNSPRYYADDGSASVPAFSFAGDVDTGMYREGTPSIRHSVAGTLRSILKSNGLAITMTSSGSAGTVLHGDGGGLIYKYTSSERYKKNIVDAALESSKIYDMRPVEYENNENSKEGDEGKPGFGLIAEEVHELFPELVIYDREGRPDSISYDRISVLLLMEIKKLKEEIEKLKENN
jgi:hypothetical protein